MVFTKKYLTNIVKVNTKNSAGNNDLMQCDEKGTYRRFLLKKRGSRVLVCLQDVLYVPGLNVSLLSITKAIEKPNVTFKASSNNLSIYIDHKEIQFQKHLEHRSGELYATDIVPHNTEAVYLTMDFDQLHNIMGHPNKAILKETEKFNNIKLTSAHHQPCPHCLKAKIRMKNIPKESREFATKNKTID
jgi:hypothetical protein